MMKRWLTLIVLCLSLNLNATTVEEAERLFSLRGEDPANALAAADIYRSLAQGTREPVSQATLLLSEAEAIYFVGYKTPLSPKEPRLRQFERGYTAAQSAAQIFRERQDRTMEARSLYWYSSNLGKWGETNGVLASLRRWPELKANSFRIRELDASVYDYGANRILGKAYFSVPFESKTEGLAFLQESYDKTLVTVLDGTMTLSRNPVNNSYLLDAYMDRNMASEFCDLYLDFADYLFEGEELWREVSPRLIPETYIEQEKFESDAELEAYFSRNC
jgi:hypothetical protein